MTAPARSDQTQAEPIPPRFMPAVRLVERLAKVGGCACVRLGPEIIPCLTCQARHVLDVIRWNRGP